MSKGSDKLIRNRKGEAKMPTSKNHYIHRAPDRPISRRQLIAGAAAFSMPDIIPSGVLAAPGRPGANERIVFGHIGCGGMGSSHIVADAAAVCDVDTSHLRDAVNRVDALRKMASGRA